MQKLYLMLQDFQKEMNKKNISSFAASMAFFLFLSLVPMLILVCAIIPYTSLTEQNLVNLITEFTVDALDPLIRGVIADVYRKPVGILSVAAITTLWSASKGILALIRGLNEVNEVEEQRNYFVLRTLASFYTFIMIVILVLSLALNVFGNVLADIILAKLPKTRIIFDFFMHFRFLAVWLVLTVLFTTIYTYVPNKKLKYKMQLPGALFSAVVWNIFSYFFSLYVDNTNSFSTYGSLSIIVIIMLWLYFSMYILLIGAQLNRFFEPDYKKWYGRMKRT
ncbi:MAG: YihY/virulence factor BrkB family protein [Lachnospiraceae bacterium]|nr:YihY/virulence factor BrkB family protein [Lachnospiraceae bacterium]